MIKAKFISIYSAYGIGSKADHELIEKIGKEGNGFVDFVFSGDNGMKSKVINQLSRKMDGLCNVNISIENNEDFETVPSLSSIKISPGNTVNLLFKISNEISENTHIIININGRNQSIIDLKSFSKNPKRAEVFLEEFNLSY